jgi:cytochrome d ubiquinol oxidase subunit II
MSHSIEAMLIAGVILIALNGYMLLAGADFGGGVWDLLASGPRRDRQRELIATAIGPVWEANHVWLILVVVLLFTCFPIAFSRVAVGLHIPLTLMVLGIVLRGSPSSSAPTIPITMWPSAAGGGPFPSRAC